MVSLLDVNVLVALLDSAHQHHAITTRWFLREQIEGWATCPITENGLIRVISGSSYPNLKVTVAQAADSIRLLRQRFAQSHTFWPNDVTLVDRAIFNLDVLSGARQTTDIYLAGLAHAKAGKLATLDQNIAWRAINGASQNLIHRIA